MWEKESYLEKLLCVEKNLTKKTLLAVGPRKNSKN